MKKVWEKPKLVALVRSKPEESVLDVCKTIDLPAGPGNMADGCGISPDIGCWSCDELTAT